MWQWADHQFITDTKIPPHYKETRRSVSSDSELFLGKYGL